ncbi:MAG: biopolymer transporter ExbD [Planctomycetota bacterium]
MGRFQDSAADDQTESVVDISPLIDCVFILLIFFIVTTTFVEETGVDVNKPQSSSAEALDKNSMLLAITPAGNVYFGGQDIGIGGVQREVKRELQKDPNTPIIIQADRDATVGIFNRVLDEVNLAGATQVSISNSPAD